MSWSGRICDHEEMRFGAEIADMIDAASYRRSSWSQLLERIGEIVPGSFVAIHNKTFPEGRLNWAEMHNIDPAFFKSYVDYYADINPWVPYWSRMRPGMPVLSEEVAPSRLFKHTEFYNDWLTPQRDLEIAVGVKVEGGGTESIQLLMHYPQRLSAHYDGPALRLFRRITGNLTRAVEIARALRSSTETAIASGALALRGQQIAFVLDAHLKILNANQAAVDAFVAGDSFLMHGERLALVDARAHDLLESCVSRLCRLEQTDVSSIVFSSRRSRWRITFAGVPGEAAVEDGLAMLLPPRRLVLVVVTELSVRRGISLDHAVGRRLFGLTPSETELCNRLLNGDTLAEAATWLGITRETARTRLKAIFSKTGTSRQAQLLMLLSALG